MVGEFNNSNEIRLNVAHLPAGSYLLQIQTEEYTLTERVIKY